MAAFATTEPLPEALLIAKVRLATGARWSEAEGLRVSQVRNGQLHFSGTKSGKNRSVPVDDALDAHLEKRYGSNKALAERYFQYGYAIFRKAVDESGLILPRGQLIPILN